jgi:enoyl-CoA hydratase
VSIEVARRGPIALIEMRHGKANAMDLAFCSELTARLHECQEAGAIVITGQGGIFSAGVDLKSVVDGGASYVRAFLPELARVFEAVFACPKPVIAAVNGHAIAGGCILACAADQRLMVSGEGRIGIPELLVGVPFPTVALEIVRAVAPRGHDDLDSLIWSGRTLLPEGAEACGLVNRVVQGGVLLSDAFELAESLAARAAAAFALTKRQLRAPAMARIADGRARFDPTVVDLWCAHSTLDAIRGYVERTLKKPAG